MNLQYMMALVIGVLFKRVKWEEELIGVMNSLMPFMLKHRRSSWMYLCCDKNNPKLLGITLTFKKLVKRIKIFNRELIGEGLDDCSDKGWRIPYKK